MRKFKRAYSRQFGICILTFTLIMSQAGISKPVVVEDTKNINLITIEDVKIYEIFDMRREIKLYIKEENKERIQNEVNNSQEFIITAYDLSIQSTGKSRDSPAFGITKDGTDLKNHTWDSAMTISTDPNVIPLGSRVELEFKDVNYEKYNGVYTSRDTGGAIENNKIDFFIGDFHSKNPSKKAINFGKTIADVTILKE